MYFQGPLWRKASQQIIKILNAIPDIQGSRVVVALSGGMDSVFLLAALTELKRKYKFELLPVHINHLVQAEAKLYENIAKKISASLNNKCYALAIRHRPQEKNLEEWMRDERYRLLEKCRRENNAHYIATAHHQSDQAETVLAHIIRGSGLQGLLGMLPVRGKIIRPMLNCSKKDIGILTHSTNLPYYNDKSNYSLNHQRNKIRHQLIPYLEKEFNPKITGRLAKLAEIAQNRT